MRLLYSLLFLGMLLGVRSSPVDHNVVIQPIPVILPFPEESVRPVLRNNETSFFQNMTKNDQQWLMTQSILVHLNDQIDLPDKVPDSLRSKMLNGQVPSNFQKAFSRWLVEEFQFSDEDIRQLLSEREVCGPVQCTTLPGLGDTCCPFG